MATTYLKWIILIFTIFLISPSTPFALNTTQNLSSFCQTTPYPNTCFDSLKLSISININPSIITFLLQTLQGAISESEKLSTLFSNANLVEKQKGSLQDCEDLQQITLSSLRKSVPKIQSSNAQKITDARVFLSAALTNKNTCLEGLESASGPLKSALENSISSTYEHVSNTLAMLSKSSPGQRASAQKDGIGTDSNRHLLGTHSPNWPSEKHGRMLDEIEDGYDPSDILTVAADGSGNFTTITDAIDFAPNNSYDRFIIYVKQGVYRENVEIPLYKTNIVLLGDGSDVTLITGDRSVAGGWTTFRSATLAVSGDGFLARDITIENTAGAVNRQAVALRVNADLTAFYRCTINGYQDTLYVHSFRQFYRECDISGTIDYLFGNAAVIFQGCNIISKMPMLNQYTVITAQSRDTPDAVTGISIQNCSIVASDDLKSNSGTIKSFLGRPWRVYSTTVYIESFIDDLIDPSGWIPFNTANEGLDTLYYGEYNNYGPGSATENRVNWTGYHVMDYYDASNFTVSEFISGDEWLDSTSFPYDAAI